METRWLCDAMSYAAASFNHGTAHSRREEETGPVYEE